MRLTLMIILALLLPAGCFNPEYGEGAYRCAATADCPAGLECKDSGSGNKICVPDTGSNTDYTIKPSSAETVADIAFGSVLPGAAAVKQGLGLMVAWNGGANAMLKDVLGSQITYATDGTISKTPALKISDRLTTDEGGMVVAYEPTTDRFVVVWMDRRNGKDYDLYAARVSPSGTLNLDDRKGKAVAAVSGSVQRNPAVACGGGVCLVLWDDDRDNALDRDVRGALLKPDLTAYSVKKADFVVADQLLKQEFPDVAFHSGRFQAVWHDSRDLSNGFDIYGVQLDTTGQVLGTTGEVKIAAAKLDQKNPDLAHDGKTWIVAWDHQRNLKDLNIRAARLKPDGTVNPADGDGLVLSNASGDQGGADIACDSGTSRCLVAWVDARDLGANKSDIYATRLDSTAFTVLDPKGIALDTRDTFQLFPLVVSDAGSFRVIWTHSVNNDNSTLVTASVVPKGK